MEQQFRNEVRKRVKRQKRRAIWKKIVSVMVCIVVFWTTYMLILPAITKESKTFCGLEEHTHRSECYQDGLICGQQEHTHSLPCYADATADVETEAQWRASLPLTEGVSKENVLLIAKSQLGYTESTKNYIVDGDGNIKGYTRYGDWYGKPYDDWGGMFAAFCLRYAGVNYPYDASCDKWVAKLQERELYKAPSDYVPQNGDLVFFDWEQDDKIDQVGIVRTGQDIQFTAIEGDKNNRVAETVYDLFDKRIAGYGVVVIPQTMADAPVREETPMPVKTDAWAELKQPPAANENRSRMMMRST